MELSPELFVELSEGARFEADAPFANRRSSSRITIAIDATLIRLSSGCTHVPAPAMVRDLSARGVGVEFNEPFQVNEPFALRFTRRDGSPLWIHCVVARWQPIGDNLFAVGAKFVKLLNSPKSTSGPPTDAVPQPTAA